MSTEVSEQAIEEFNDGVRRTFDAFPSQSWVDDASAVVRGYGSQAAAQLVAGEQVEWVTPGIVHRYGKVWPNSVLVVTPHRLILSTSRGSLRAKHEVNALYRGPESLLGTARRLLPGSNRELWMLELASESGPFVFAFPDFNRAGELAELTGAFVTGRAVHHSETQLVLLDGVPHDPGSGIVAAAFDQAATEPASFERRSFEEPVTMAMPATLADPSGATALRTTPITIPQQYTPSDLYDAPSSAPEPAPEPVPEPTPEPVVVTDPAPSYTAVAAPDWYDDPLGQARLRYWDGTAGTHAVVG